MSTSISHHTWDDNTTVGIKAYTNQGIPKTNWISLLIGGISLSVFFPTPAGVKAALKKIQEPFIIEDGLEQTPSMKSTSTSISIPVEITSYNADPAQTDDTPLITASGQKVREGICALSRDIEEEYGLEFGDLIDLGEWGVYEFQDRMNKRIKKGVDIFKWSRDEALQIGRREGTATFEIKES